MSTTENTTTPAAPAAPATRKFTGAASQDLADLIGDGLQNLGDAIENAKPAEKPAHQEVPQTAPVDQKPVPDRRFKLTPQSEEEKATEKPAEKPATQDIPDPLETAELEGAQSDASKASFKSLRDAYKNSKAEITKSRTEAEALRKELEALKAQKPVEPPTADYEAVKAENKKLADQLAKVDYANSPEFIAKYKAPIDAALGEAQETLAYNDKNVDLRTLLSKPVKDINAELANITKGMNEWDKQVVFSAVRQASKLDAGAREALANAQTNVQVQQQRSLYNSRAEFENTWNQTGIGQFLAKHSAPADADASTRSFIEAYNAGVDNIKPTAERYAFSPLAPAEAAGVAQKAAFADFYIQNAMPAIERFIGSISAERDAAVKELAAIKQSRSIGAPTGELPGNNAPSRVSNYKGHGMSLPDMSDTIRSLM